MTIRPDGDVVRPARRRTADARDALLWILTAVLVLAALGLWTWLAALAA